MANFAIQLQLRVLDRPVIDQTGLTDRYDFTLNWRPNSSFLALRRPSAPLRFRRARTPCQICSPHFKNNSA
jgi:uncharacterized protein (TIGR03435 family)